MPEFLAAQGHHLHDRHRDVRAGRLRLVAPAAVRALAFDDEVGRFFDRGLERFVAGLAVKLGEGENGHGVAIHVAPASADHVAVVFALRSDEEAGGLGDFGAVLPLVGKMPLRHEGKHRIGGNGGVMGVGAVGEAAVGILAVFKPAKGLGSRFLGGVIHLDAFFFLLLSAGQRDGE